MREPDLALVYLLTQSFQRTLRMPLRGESTLAGSKGRAVDAQDVYAMVEYWPDHKVVELKKRPDSETHSFRIERVDSNASLNPHIEIWTDKSWAEAQRMVPLLTAYFEREMNPKELEGKDLFLRMSAVDESWRSAEREKESARKKALEDAERAAEDDRRRQARAAEIDDPKTDFHRAALSMGSGEDFKIEFAFGNYGATREARSSREAALKALRNPKLNFAYLQETPRNPPRKEGFVAVSVGLREQGSNPDHDASPVFHYWAPPAASLVEQAELKADTPEATAPPNPLRRRGGAI